MSSQYRNTVEKKLSAVETIFITSGTILATRIWSGGTIHELDVHLPRATLDKWEQAQSIKCRISALHYTDYTPARWNVNAKTCTLYIDTSHSGPGSLWAKDQVVGNDFHYLKIEAQKQAPLAGKRLVFLGDQTGIGHFCSLQQLATENTPVSGFIAFNDGRTAAAFAENCSWLPLQAIASYEAIYQQTLAWAISHQADRTTYMIYIVGRDRLSVALRKLLKTYGFEGSQIKSMGFWR